MPNVMAMWPIDVKNQVYTQRLSDQAIITLILCSLILGLGPLLEGQQSFP